MTLPIPASSSTLVPLLRSIAREIRERTAAIRELEARRDAFSKTPKIHQLDRCEAEAELAIQRRELRGIEKELQRLGCHLDEHDPLRIVVPGEGRSYTFSWELDQTQLYARPLTAKAAETAS